MQHTAIIKYASVTPLPVRFYKCQVAVLRLIDWREKLFILVGYRVYPHSPMLFKKSSDKSPAVREL